MLFRFCPSRPLPLPSYISTHLTPPISLSFSSPISRLEGGNIHMLKGTLLHLVFQEALKTMRFDAEFLQSVANQAISSNSVLNDLILLGIDESVIRKEIGALLASVKLWAEKMVTGVGGAGGEKPGEHWRGGLASGIENVFHVSYACSLMRWLGYSNS